GGDLCAEDARELQSQMAQAPDADDTDAGGRGDAVGAQRRVDGDAGAEQRRGVFAVECLGNGNDETCRYPYRVGEAAVAVHAGRLRLGAQILFSRATPLAIAATSRLPAHADSLTRLQVADRRANRFHGAHYFVAGNERKFADLPIV